MHGYLAEELLGMRIAKINKDEPSEVQQRFTQIVTQGFWLGEMEHRKKDGTSFPVYMSISLLKDVSDKPLGTLAIARTLRTKELEAQLQQAQKMEAIGALAGGIATTSIICWWELSAIATFSNKKSSRFSSI